MIRLRASRRKQRRSGHESVVPPLIGRHGGDFSEPAEIFEPALGGIWAQRRAVLVEAATKQKAAEGALQSGGLLSNPNSPVVAGNGGSNSESTPDTHTELLQAVTELCERVRLETVARLAALDLAGDVRRLCADEREARKRVFAAEAFERQAPVDYFLSFTASHKLGGIIDAEVTGRKAILVDFCGFHDFATQSEPLWRFQAGQKTKRREFEEAAMRALRLEADELINHGAATRVQFDMELEEITRRFPPRAAPPVAPPPSAFVYSWSASGGLGGADTSRVAAASAIIPTAAAPLSSLSPPSHSPVSSPAPGSSTTTSYHQDPYARNSAVPPPQQSPYSAGQTSQPYATPTAASAAAAVAAATARAPTALDFTHQRLRDDDLRRLERPPNDPRELENLNISYNNLRTLDTLPRLPKLHTLQMASNEFADSGAIVRDLKVKCPKLQHLTLAPNPCAPANMTPDVIANYRAYVVANVPTLTVLDYQAVSAEDRARAQRNFPNGMPAAAAPASAPRPPPQHQQQWPPAPSYTAYNHQPQYPAPSAYGGVYGSNTGGSGGGVYGSAYGSRQPGGAYGSGGGVYGSGYGRY